MTKEELEKENDELKEGLAVGSMWNKHLNSLNKELEEDRDKYRNMAFDKDKQLTKAKEIIRKCIEHLDRTSYFHYEIITEAEQFLKEE